MEPIDGDVFKPLKRVKASKPRKVTLDSRVGKYFIARKKGMNKKQSAITAGYSQAVAHNATDIEETQAFQQLEKIYYKDELMKKISIQEIAEAHADNIKQNKDRGARNKAIEMALGKIEPEAHTKEDDQMIVILKE